MSMQKLRFAKDKIIIKEDFFAEVKTYDFF